MKLLDGVKAGATLSPCGAYRYALFRDWFPKDGRGHVLWIMLNPSSADADQDDPTVRRCQEFARSWGYDGITVANLFALRSTSPKALYSHPEPVGDLNDSTIDDLATAAGTGLVVGGWGTHGAVHSRGLIVGDRLAAAGVVVHCLGRTKAGHPVHPLYVKGETKPEPWGQL